MATVKEGDRRGFLVATGRERSSSSRHRHYEFRCLACGDGVVWKRGSDFSGRSCGCLKSLHGSIWASALRDAPTFDVAKVLRSERYEAAVQEIRRKIEEMAQKSPAGESDHVTSSDAMEAVPEPPTPSLATEEALELPPSWGEPVKVKKPRKPREKSAKGRKVQPAVCEEPQHTPSTVAESTTVESPEASIKTTDVAEPTPSCS